MVGSKKALGMAVRRIDTRQRHTTLRKRLQEAQQVFDLLAALEIMGRRPNPSNSAKSMS
jgi:hypothetical protein